MPRYVAFLRAINVGYGRTVKMSVLREIFESLGFSHVETFIASGNVVFDCGARNVKSIEGQLEAALLEALRHPVDVFLRSDAELSAIANYDPFPGEQGTGPGDLNVIFLAAPLDSQSAERVTALSTDTALFCVHGREVYWLRRPAQAGEVFPGLLLERALPPPFTMRSMRTVRRMALKYGRT